MKVGSSGEDYKLQTQKDMGGEKGFKEIKGTRLEIGWYGMN